MCRPLFVQISIVKPLTLWANKMEHKYKGWIVEKMGSDHFNMRLETESNWHDAANTFREAKQIIDRLEGEK